jgi:hypothetical protein
MFLNGLIAFTMCFVEKRHMRFSLLNRDNAFSRLGCTLQLTEKEDLNTLHVKTLDHSVIVASDDLLPKPLVLYT